ncbi:hypothetical protein CDV31_010499 [Fusarium ambrosium]|nr:hypothetical protein CDV31_010499 [Fusarium ambrosium]
MSHLLWKYYWEDDVDRFRRLLAPTSYNAQAVSRSPAIGGSGSFFGGSYGGPGTSPRSVTKQRRASGHPQTPAKSKDANTNLGRAEINSRDHAGLTVLLRAASSTDPNAYEFVRALIEHPAIDLYAQDPESGWNALHRSLYAGNVSIARLLLEKERVDLTNHNLSAVNKVGLLIKTKDHEGNSPFDVYNSTIAARSLNDTDDGSSSDSDADSVDSTGDGAHQTLKVPHAFQSSIDGDELFVFGSNKNVSLGVGDEDDRQYPERIHLSRPDLLVHRFHHSHLESLDMEEPSSLDLDQIPTLVRNRPLIIQDVAMSKLHSAILTTDPVSNLYICGVGRGGRLGLGHENTKFRFVPVEGPFIDKKVHQVALGQNHSMAVAGNGELWTWGLNSCSQLGYALPPPMKADEEPMSLTPRQVFGSLKKEIVLGVAASANHSVAHTGSSLFTWGRNVGQLALMDADSRSLDVQPTPRKVAASLLAAPIDMVSAIDKATICLLSNHTVWVFSHYGYNLVKFPFPDVFTNHTLTNSSYSNRYDPGRREISSIASGGETIAAVTARGDLFTLHLNHKGDPSQSAASTTNPVKIKNALTQPQCIWDSRKDGAASVGVGEHGSVIICTESGAVWKRVKRTKGKMTEFAESGAKRKDFKFQRVPYITNCVAVRSSIFGAFAAIRKDSKVMAQEIKISEKSLRDEISSLLCLNSFQAPDLGETTPGHEALKKAIVREKPGSVPYEILRSSNIVQHLLNWLSMNSFQFGDMNMAICSSDVPEVRIPVHSWVLAGRSSVLRHGLSELRNRGSSFSTDSFSLEIDEDKALLTLFGVDIYTVLNIVVHAYQDSFVPVWRYTRESPAEAPRFRRVRTELMKVATKLALPKLEAAVRLQTGVDESLDADFKQAIYDPSFFDDGDIIIELDGEDVTAHSQLLCQRCPFFEGLFNGRSQGQWLAGRRDGMGEADKIRVDLKHIDPDIFHYVMSFIYADIGQELFDEVSVSNLDELSELVLGVMSAANELMLDRLSQVCQSLIGKFVTTRNISNLLNEISPCSVTEFKDTGLEYICLQLESMLENHLLDDLDEDLLFELDEVVRDNQLARLPFARSGRATLLLHEKYPELAADIDEERQIRIKEMAFKAMQRGDEKKLSSSFKARIGSLDDGSPLQTPDTTRRKSRSVRNEPFSPNLRPKQSQAELIFDMDDEDDSSLTNIRSPVNEPSSLRLPIDTEDMPQLPKAWREAKGKEPLDVAQSPTPNAFSLSPMLQPSELGVTKSSSSAMSKPGAPWAASTLATSKLDLKDIMSEASTSALTAGLQAQKTKDATANKPQAKISQKERKRQLQAQAAAEAAARDETVNRVPWEPVPSGGKPAPWKTASPGPKTSLKEAMTEDAKITSVPSVKAKPLVASETKPKSATRRTASPDTRFPGQGRTNSSPAIVAGPSAAQTSKPLVPHSKSYITPAPKAEPTLGFTLADIIGQQEREQEAVKEAVAKRSLQEIQQEQAFQEWWDQESRRTQEEEARRKQKESRDKESKGARRGRRGRGGKAKNAGEAATDGGQGGGVGTGANANSRPSVGGRGGSGRGRGGKGRGNKSQTT